MLLHMKYVHVCLNFHVYTRDELQNVVTIFYVSAWNSNYAVDAMLLVLLLRSNTRIELFWTSWTVDNFIKF